MVGGGRLRYASRGSESRPRRLEDSLDRPSTAWTCPNCRRVVPPRFDECRCGMVRGTAGPDAPLQEEEARGGFSIGEWAGLAVMVVAAIAGYRQLRGGTGPAEKKVPDLAVQAGPAPPAPSARPPLAVGLTEAATPLPMAS